MAVLSKDLVKLRGKILDALDKKDIRKALSLGQRMTKMPSATVEDCISVSEMGQQYVDPQTTLLGIRGACKRAPNSLPLLLQLSFLEDCSGFTKDAVKHLIEAEGLCRTASDFDKVGTHWWRLDEAQRAYEAFVKADELEPNNPNYLASLGMSHGFLGRAVEGEAFCDRAIAAGNKKPLTYSHRSWLRKQTEDNNHLAELELAIGELPTDDPGITFLQFAIFKELEDLNRFDEAFDVLEQAGKSMRKHIDYVPEREIEELDAIMNAYDASLFEKNIPGCNSSEPIFILGLPRSGSTLVERIISCHSDVFAAGELSNLDRIVGLKSGAYAREAGLDNDHPVINALQTDLRSLGKSYVASTRPRTGHTLHFIDKRPTNLISCGLIGLALPNARIVHTWRNPMDACYSVLKQSFGKGYGYSYDQKELGTYYIAYRKLMDHWDKVMPGKIIHVKYEDVVADTEAVSRDLIQRLGLEWQDACLDHTSNKQASMTASANQIRQPIYKSSVEKWRQFEDRLGVLKQTLEDGGIDVG